MKRAVLTLCWVLLSCTGEPSGQASTAACVGAKCDGVLPNADIPARWTILIYAANDDSRSDSLREAFDADEEEWRFGIGGSQAVNVVIQRDRAEPSDYNVDTERYLLRHGKKYHPVTGEEGVLPLDPDDGDFDSSSRENLEAFLVDSIQRFPADRYYLIVTGHGDGWNELLYDAAPANAAAKSMGFGDFSAALQTASSEIARQHAGKRGLSARFDIVQFDACHMGQVETAGELSSIADYMIASQDIVPDAGHPYRVVGSTLQSSTDQEPRTLVKQLVTEYARAYTEYYSMTEAPYRGTEIAVAGLDLRAIRAQTRTFKELAQSLAKVNLTCGDLYALRQSTAPVATIDNDADAGRGPQATESSVDAIALLERFQSLDTREIKRDANKILEAIGRPKSVSGIPLHKPEYLRRVSFAKDSPYVVEAQRFEGTPKHGAVSLFWPSPVTLKRMQTKNIYGDLPLLQQRYSELGFARATGWLDVFTACHAEIAACKTARGTACDALAQMNE